MATGNNVKDTHTPPAVGNWEKPEPSSEQESSIGSIFGGAVDSANDYTSKVMGGMSSKSDDNTTNTESAPYQANVENSVTTPETYSYNSGESSPSSWTATPTFYDDINPENKISDNDGVSSNPLRLYLPKFGVDEYINDRTIWQRQMYTAGAEQGWFYFKIFFNFQSSYGLLADLLQEEGTRRRLSKNSAIYYLALISDRYAHERINDRMLALYKFGSTLKSIQTETPWLFKGISGLDAVNPTNLTDLGKQKTIEITLNTETADQRLGTLFDLYKYAAYDQLNSKEIIPPNLRKFDMSILCYHIPIKNFQTAIIDKTATSKGIIPSKKTYINKAEDFSNMMSYKLYILRNCEFDITTLNTYMPSSLTNETAFNIAGNNIKINYDKAFELRMNEFSEFMFGTTGFYYNETMPENVLGQNLTPNKNPYLIYSQGNKRTQQKRMAVLHNRQQVYEFTNLFMNYYKKVDSFNNTWVTGDGQETPFYTNNNGERVSSDYFYEKIKKLQNAHGGILRIPCYYNGTIDRIVNPNVTDDVGYDIHEYNYHDDYNPIKYNGNPHLPAYYDKLHDTIINPNFEQQFKNIKI